MNSVVLIGRLVRDPELKFAANSDKAVCNFTLAVDRYKGDADFLPVVTFGKTAENVASYLGKGRMVAVQGRIQTRSYDAKDGTKRYVTEIMGNEVKFLDKADDYSKVEVEDDLFG